MTACAVLRCVCIASAVTTRPFGAGIPYGVGTAAISFDRPSTRTGCGGEREAASKNDRRNALLSIAITPPPPIRRPILGKPQHRPLPTDHRHPV